VKTALVVEAQLGAEGRTPPATTAGLAHPHWWMAGMPIGAEFDRAELGRVLGKVLVHDQAAVNVAEGASAFNTSRIAAAAEEFEADETMTMVGSVGSSARLVGYLGGTVEAATVGAAMEAQARTDAFVSVATTVVGWIPVTGALVKFIDGKLTAQIGGGRPLGAFAKSGVGYGVGEGTSALLDAMTPTTDSVGHAQATANDAAYTAESQLRLTATIAAATSRHIPEAARYDSEGQLLPWLQPGVDVEKVLSDPVVIRQYLVPWSMEGSGFVTTLTSEVGTAFDKGREAGLR